MGKWRSFYCHLPCGWLRLSTKTRFLCPGSGGARGRVARRGIPAPPTPTAGAWLRKVALLCGRRPDDGDVAWGGECDESVASPLIISISPSLIRRPSPGSRREWVCERGGALKQPGLAACDEAHTWSEWSLITAAVICRVRLSSGDRSLPRACTLVSSWVQEGSVERGGPPPRDGWRVRMPGRTPGSAAGPKEDEAADRSRRPRAPDPRGERVRPPDSAPYLEPSFQNTAPPSQPAQHDEDTRSPVYFGHFIPFGHFVLLFLLNKSLSEAWRHAHCVCRLLLPPQWWRMRARRSLDSAVGQHRWRHPLSLAEVRENPHWDGGTTETASQPLNG